MAGAGAKSVIGVSAGALQSNVRRLLLAANAGAAMPDTELLAVIKANAYGHGAALCAPVLVEAGAHWLGVTDAEEGAQVRVALQGRPAEVLVMCGAGPGAREEARLVREHALTPVVWMAEQVLLLAEVAPGVRVHVEVDTGMSRQGLRAGTELAALLRTIRETDGAVRLGGLMTHFASAEVVGAAETREQQARFEVAVGQVAAELEATGAPVWLHAGNTSVLDEGRLMPWWRAQRDRLGGRGQLLARAGLALYGYALPLEGETCAPAVRAGLYVAGTWRTRIVSVREVEAGAAVGYNGTFMATQSMRLALLPVGYADGYRRELSGTRERAGGWALVRGQRAPVVGRVSMNLLTVDVTEIAGAAAGDEAMLLGAEPAMSAEAAAELAGTIAYEIVCGMRGERVLEP